MSIDQNKAIVRSFFEQVINQGRFDLADEIFAPEFSGHGLAGGAAIGPDGPKRAAQEWRAAFPDVQFTVDELIAEGDKVVVRVTLRGTHLGPFQSLAPPAGRSSPRAWSSRAWWMAALWRKAGTSSTSSACCASWVRSPRMEGRLDEHA